MKYSSSRVTRAEDGYAFTSFCVLNRHKQEQCQGRHYADYSAAYRLPTETAEQMSNSGPHVVLYTSVFIHLWRR
jgi:hypothetical protein